MWPRFPQVRLDTPYNRMLVSSTWMIRPTFPGGAPAFHPNLFKGVRLMNARRSSLAGQFVLIQRSVIRFLAGADTHRLPKW